jgi:predicted RNase H-like nuclease (RuvC/YqgF family)
MRVFLAMLLTAGFVQAQSLADLARQERERQAHLKPTQTITATGSGVPAPASTPATKTEEPKKAPVDPLKEYNDQVEKLRAKIRSLQDEETATTLQINALNTQVYAPVVDQPSKDQALAAVAAAQMKLADLRRELTETTKALEALDTQGPPKSKPPAETNAKPAEATAK